MRSRRLMKATELVLGIILPTIASCNGELPCETARDSIPLASEEVTTSRTSFNAFERMIANKNLHWMNEEEGGVFPEWNYSGTLKSLRVEGITMRDRVASPH